jgi:hypothetical protein
LRLFTAFDSRPGSPFSANRVMLVEGCIAQVPAVVVQTGGIEFME